MSKHKHTPGPWFERGGAVVYGNDGVEGYGGVVADLIESCGTSRPAEQLNANAKLIAAAPDLLEACEALLRHCWSDAEARVGLVAMGAYRGKNQAAEDEFARTDRIAGAMEMARAAIHKATN